MSSDWDQNNMTDKIRLILSNAPVDGTYGNGRRFMTPYQISIEFAHQFPGIASSLGHSTGGQGNGPYGLPTYIARWLPDRITRGLATGIEMAFLWSDHISSLQFNNFGASLTATDNAAFIMFRLQSPRLTIEPQQ